jgi:hypothetical protein
MTMLKFILYILKHGSLKSTPVEFRKIEDTHLKHVINKNKKGNRLYTRLRDRLAINKFIGPLLGNVAYLKASSRQHINFFFVDALQIGYVRILKAASTSVLRELLPIMDTSLKDQILSDKQIDLLAERYVTDEIVGDRNHYDRFTIVRNPFHRLVSVYLDLFNPKNPHFGYQTYLFGILKHNMSFAEFVKTISIIPDRLKSGHFIHQINVIKKCGGIEKIKCFRLEKDVDQLETFLTSKGIALGHRNKNISDYNFYSYYNMETVALVYSIYKDDVEIFGYEDEYRALLAHLNG